MIEGRLYPTKAEACIVFTHYINGLSGRPSI